MIRHLHLPLTLTLLAAAAVAQQPTGWLEWRGPAQNGTSTETDLPDGWSQVSLVCTSFDPIAGENVTRTLFSEGSPGPDTAFPIAPGVTAECEILNVGPPTVSVTKTVDGTSTDWSFECGSPNTLSRQGWKPSTLKPGDAITVVANPMKDGTSAGLMYTVELADGRTLGPGALAQPSAAPAAR